MPGMNINGSRDVVLRGQISTLTQQIIDLKTYSERTGVDESTAILAKENQIAAINALITGGGGGGVLPPGGQTGDILVIDPVIGPKWQTPAKVASSMPLASENQAGLVKSKGMTITTANGDITVYNVDFSDGEEHDTGQKWVDGKTIYGKGFQSQTGTMTIATGVDTYIGAISSFDILYTGASIHQRTAPAGLPDNTQNFARAILNEVGVLSVWYNGPVIGERGIVFYTK